MDSQFRTHLGYLLIIIVDVFCTGSLLISFRLHRKDTVHKDHRIRKLFLKGFYAGLIVFDKRKCIRLRTHNVYTVMKDNVFGLEVDDPREIPVQMGCSDSDGSCNMIDIKDPVLVHGLRNTVTAEINIFKGSLEIIVLYLIIGNALCGRFRRYRRR